MVLGLGVEEVAVAAATDPETARKEEKARTFQSKRTRLDHSTCVEEWSHHQDCGSWTGSRQPIREEFSLMAV
ncbi:hypothetical protein EYF80_057539 [Liparis tanakae]|uniref:Uncharacterized protein n=1 Tax=Liparis tanakae TaxID=230148 RepID=A0A4Z2EVB7_9TELE|nr:hypothetical protein EYF80_057539 [Liparis tanakae]